MRLILMKRRDFLDTLDVQIQSNSQRFSWKTFQVKSNIYLDRFKKSLEIQPIIAIIWFANQSELKTSLSVTVTMPFTTYSQFQIPSRADPLNKLSSFFGRSNVPRNALKTWPERTPAIRDQWTVLYCPPIYISADQWLSLISACDNKNTTK